MKNSTGYKAIDLFFAVFHVFTKAERKSAVGLASICLAEYLPDNRLLQTAYILLLFFLKNPGEDHDSGIYSYKGYPEQAFTSANWNLDFHFSYGPADKKLDCIAPNKV